MSKSVEKGEAVQKPEVVKLLSPPRWDTNCQREARQVWLGGRISEKKQKSAQVGADSIRILILAAEEGAGISLELL